MMPEGSTHEGGDQLALQKRWVDEGDIWACLDIGEAYESGRMGEPDLALAAQWYRRGAEGGDADCQSALARLYETGSGMQQDLEAAWAWHRRAAEGGNADSAYWLGHRLLDGIDGPANPTRAMVWLRHGCRAGDRRCMTMLARPLLDGNSERDRQQASWWMLRAAELGEPEAQIRLAGMLAGPNAWSRYGVFGDRVEAQYWLNAARRHMLSPDLQGLADAVAKSADLPQLSCTPPKPSAMRRMLERGWSLIRSDRPSTLLPVAELAFKDIPMIGASAMQTLLRHCEKGDCVWALAPAATGRASRVRHFFLTVMSERAARFLMRDMLLVEVEGDQWRRHHCRENILDHLRALVEDGTISLPVDLAEELERRRQTVSKAADIEHASPLGLRLYDFTGEVRKFSATHMRLASRAQRDEPLSPPHGSLPPGWYADRLGDQPNAVIRAAMRAVPEAALLGFLAATTPFTRFRAWEASSSTMRARLVTHADSYHPPTPDYLAAARDAMDTALAELHRDGRIGWWPEPA